MVRVMHNYSQASVFLLAELEEQTLPAEGIIHDEEIPNPQVAP